MEKEPQKIRGIEQLLAIAGSNLNILEEEVDMKVQQEYFRLAHELSQKADANPDIKKEYLERINDLFDEDTDTEVKKRMLVVLANVADVAVYRTIESFSKQASPLQKWAVIALQQSRMLLQSSLLDDPGVFISTGLGGQGMLLRYFCVFFNRKPGELPAFQQNTLKNELETVIRKAEGSIESIEFKQDFTIALLLLPLQTDLQDLFAGLIDECNLYGNFLHENIIITNVKKLTENEIYQLLHNRNPRLSIK